jgi:transcriptional regulator with XRE-family HTH domain
MSDMYAAIGEKIRELRGKASQEALAADLGIKPNKLSRWETGTYKPTAVDLDNLARYFDVPITVFFPGQIEESNERVSALASATGGLDEKDFEEVIRYAEFRKAQIQLNKVKRQKK